MARETHRSSEILDAVALLVVDMQDAFLNVMPDREGVLRRTALAIESARAFGIKVIFTEQVPAKLGPTNADLLALAPEARVFAKNEFSALLAEGLQEHLRRINVYHLLIAGIETPICIYQTALHAQDHELDVTILSDCTAGRRADDCIIVLEALARADCHVLPAETVFYSMLGSSQNPRFAHFTRIVKRYSGDGPIDGGPTPAPEPEARTDSESQPAPRQGERHQAARHSDRHDQRRGHDQRRQHPDPRDEEAPAETPEDSENLRAEDGISEDEANQPSYEEATAEHSSEEAPVIHGRRHHAPQASKKPVSSEGETSEPEGDDESDGEGESADDQAAPSQGEGGDDQKKKRPRRRRGGARRRRARERAAGGTGPSTEGVSDALPARDSGAASGPAEGSAPAAD